MPWFICADRFGFLYVKKASSSKEAEERLSKFFREPIRCEPDPQIDELEAILRQACVEELHIPKPICDKLDVEAHIYHPPKKPIEEKCIEIVRLDTTVEQYTKNEVKHKYEVLLEVCLLLTDKCKERKEIDNDGGIIYKCINDNIRVAIFFCRPGLLSAH